MSEAFCYPGPTAGRDVGRRSTLVSLSKSLSRTGMCVHWAVYPCRTLETSCDPPSDGRWDHHHAWISFQEALPKWFGIHWRSLRDYLQPAQSEGNRIQRRFFQLATGIDVIWRRHVSRFLLTNRLITYSDSEVDFHKVEQEDTRDTKDILNTDVDGSV